jgi:hypothetical protein
MMWRNLAKHCLRCEKVVAAAQQLFPVPGHERRKAHQGIVLAEKIRNKQGQGGVPIWRHASRRGVQFEGAVVTGKDGSPDVDPLSWQGAQARGVNLAEQGGCLARSSRVSISPKSTQAILQTWSVRAMPAHARQQATGVPFTVAGESLRKAVLKAWQLPPTENRRSRDLCRNSEPTGDATRSQPA